MGLPPPGFESGASAGSATRAAGLPLGLLEDRALELRGVARLLRRTDRALELREAERIEPRGLFDEAVDVADVGDPLGALLLPPRLEPARRALEGSRELFLCWSPFVRSPLSHRCHISRPKSFRVSAGDGMLSPLRLPISPPRCRENGVGSSSVSAPAPPIMRLIMGPGAKSFGRHPRSLAGSPAIGTALLCMFTTPPAPCPP